MLAPLGLDFEVQGTLIRVTPPALETRLFDLNLLNVRRGLRRTAGQRRGARRSRRRSAADDVMGGDRGGRQVAAVRDADACTSIARAGSCAGHRLPERLDRVASVSRDAAVAQRRQVRLAGAGVRSHAARRRRRSTGARCAQRLGLPRRPGRRHRRRSRGAARRAGARRATIRDAVGARRDDAQQRAGDGARVDAGRRSSLTMTVVPQISADGIVQLSMSHAWEETTMPGAESTPLTRSARSTRSRA